MLVYGSLLQSGLDGHPVFCIVIGVVMVYISKDWQMDPILDFVYVSIYVDDIVFQCQLGHVATLMLGVARTLETFSSKLPHREYKI